MRHAAQKRNTLDRAWSTASQHAAETEGTATTARANRHPERKKQRVDDSWVQPEPVVYGFFQVLARSEVPFRRLDGSVAEQKLDLLQFAARRTA